MDNVPHSVAKLKSDLDMLTLDDLLKVYDLVTSVTRKRFKSDPIFSKKIKDLTEISILTRNALIYEGIHHCYDLLRLSKKDILRISGVGNVGLKAILEVCKKYNLKLQENESDFFH